MKEMLRKFENLWVSVAFAESGEYETLKELPDRDVCDRERPEIYQVI